MTTTTSAAIELLLPTNYLATDEGYDLAGELERIAPRNGFWNKVAHAFHLMDVAESAINEVCATIRNKTLRDAVHRGAFKYLMPGPFLAEAGDRVYRAHCLELVKRYRDDGDMDAATNIEIGTALAQASLIAPLRYGPTSAALDAWRRAGIDLFTDDWQEKYDYPGYLDEVRADVDKQVRRVWQTTNGGRMMGRDS